MGQTEDVCHCFPLNKCCVCVHILCFLLVKVKLMGTLFSLLFSLFSVTFIYPKSMGYTFPWGSPAQEGCPTCSGIWRIFGTNPARRHLEISRLYNHRKQNTCWGIWPHNPWHGPSGLPLAVLRPWDLLSTGGLWESHCHDIRPDKSILKKEGLILAHCWRECSPSW